MGALSKYNLAFDIPKEYENAKRITIQEMAGKSWILISLQMYESRADKYTTEESKKGVHLIFKNKSGEIFRCATHGVAIVEMCQRITDSGDDVQGVEFTVTTRKSNNDRTVYVIE